MGQHLQRQIWKPFLGVLEGCGGCCVGQRALGACIKCRPCLGHMGAPRELCSIGMNSLPEPSEWVPGRYHLDDRQPIRQGAAGSGRAENQSVESGRCTFCPPGVSPVGRLWRSLCCCVCRGLAVHAVTRPLWQLFYASSCCQDSMQVTDMPAAPARLFGREIGQSCIDATRPFL